MSDDWWSGLAAVEQQLECGPRQHRLLWQGGRLAAADHPDADRERALVALGADPVPCLATVDLWQRHDADLDVLVLGSRGPVDPLSTAEPAVDPLSTTGVLYGGGGQARYAALRAARTSAGWSSYGPTRHPHRHWQHHPPGAGSLEGFLGSGGALPDRLVSTVIAEWAGRIESSDDRVEPAVPQLRAALYGRLGAAIRTWIGKATPVSLTMVGPGHPPSASRDGDRIRVELPFRWLRDVWAKGMSTVLGQLCLSADSTGTGGWRLTTIAPDLSGTRTMTVTIE